MMKLPQNPLLRQVHRFRESLLLLLYYSLSFLGVRWMRARHPRLATAWSVTLWVKMVLRGMEQVVRMLVPVLQDAEARRARAERARAYQPR
ncbi:MAG: hypothetical protein ACOH1B_04715 [Rothia mucilaginosa]